MEALGREFNIVPTAKGVWINLKDADSVTFIGVKAGGDTYTVQSARDVAGTGAANLVTTQHWYENSTDTGGTPWTRPADQATGAVVTSTANVVAIEINGDSLPALHRCVKVTSASTALVYAITHDLTVQRKPANLAAVAV